VVRVLVQAGHNDKRQPGFESGTGASGFGTTEIREVARIQQALVKLLKDDGRFAVTACPGEMPANWSGDVFLSLHCDGAGSLAAQGFSLGWPPEEAGPKTARLRGFLAEEYASIEGHPVHHSDNYTADMRGYYGYRRCDADAKVLVEHGFLTNAHDARWIRTNTDAIARAHYRALLRYAGLGSAVAGLAAAAETHDFDMLGEWVYWRLGLGKFKGRARDPEVRPNVPDAVPRHWWPILELVHRARIEK
jgi:N-acetylmuramoyl-L-alanine amidase